MGVKEYYNAVVNEIEVYEQQLLPKISKNIRLEIILKHIGSEPVRILDVGGGSGRYTIELAKKGHYVTLNDLSNKSLELAKNKISKLGLNDKVNYLEGDVLNLEINEESYDAVICEGSTFSYIADPSHFLKIARKVLKPGGLLLVTVASLFGVLLNRSSVVKEIIDIHNNNWNFINEAIKNRYIIESEKFNVKLRLYTLSEITSILEKENFTCIDYFGRNVWDILLNREEIQNVVQKRGENTLVSFEKSLHRNKGLVDICHSIAIFSRRDK